MNMLTGSLCFAQTQVPIPQELKDNIKYGLLVIMAVAAVFCVIKCIQGRTCWTAGRTAKGRSTRGLQSA